MKNNKEVKTTHAPPQDSLKVCERNFFSHVLTNSVRYIFNTNEECGFTFFFFFYFGGAQSKGFPTFRNVSKLTLFGKIGHANSLGFQFYSGV